MLVEHLEDMVASATLYMRRLDCLDDFDADEGRWLPGAESVVFTSGTDARLMRDSLEAGRGRLFVSCWTRGLTDRDAMWGRWGPDAQVVAVRSTWRDLWAALEPGDDDCVIGGVRYTDDVGQFVEWFPLTNAFNLAFCKRKAFAYEKEVRVAHLSEGSDLPEAVRISIELRRLNAQVIVPSHASPNLVGRVRDAAGGLGWAVTRPGGVQDS